MVAKESIEEIKEEKTAFRVLLDAVVADLSESDGKNYVIDELSYNEHDISFYISVMTEKEEEAITKEEISEYLWELFRRKEEDGAVYLYKKDNRELIIECVDLKKQYMLDCTLMGITNEEIDEKSKGFYISQNNPEFLTMPYGSSSVARSGCGPIALTMAINYVSGEEKVKLPDVVSWALEKELYVKGSGTKWVLMSAYPPTLGVKSSERYIESFSEFEKLFSDGSAVITSMKQGHFTNNGHFIVILGIKDGKASVLDPASITRSLTEWDAELVFEESKKCFWKISMD